MYPQLEDKFYTWLLINKRTVNKISVRWEDVRIQKKGIIKASDDADIYKDFNISDIWISRFMERHNLLSRAATHRAQENLKSQAYKASQVAQYFNSLNTINRNYEQQYIIQMGETPTYIDMPADRIQR
jgi:hypothetical protein